MPTTKRISKEEAIKRIRDDIRLHGVPQSRRYYAARWHVPPSTVYYWIREALEQHQAAEEANA